MFCAKKMRFIQLEIKGKKLFKKFLVPCNCLIGKFGFITATELTQRERERVNIISIYLTPPPQRCCIILTRYLVNLNSSIVDDLSWVQCEQILMLPEYTNF